MVAIKISGVCERDIDLLLLEEFVASPPFRAWFLAKISVTAPAELTEVARSVTTANGESDLELTFQVNGKCLKVLVENKVDATFQPRQAERYRERALNYLASGACSEAVTVIIAPDEYFADEYTRVGFQHRLSYQAILSWFEKRGNADERSSVKCALLKGAIDRAGSGWQLWPDKVTSGFWLNYWELASARTPALRMPRPSGKAKKSSFILFKPPKLKPGVKLVHKVRHGNVDLQFARFADRIQELEQLCEKHLRPGMHLDRAGKSAVVRVCVPKVNTIAPFADSVTAVQQGLQAALDLLDLYQSIPWQAQRGEA